MRSGIYEIHNTITGKSYIGSAVYFANRFAVHRSNLRSGKHKNTKLLNAWKKHGEHAFVFRELLICRPQDLVMYEQLLIDAFDAVNSGYNVLPTAGSALGFKHSADHIERLKGNTHALGHRHDEETLRRMAEALRGNKHSLGAKKSEYARRRVSETMKGKKQSPEQIEKRVAAYKATVAKRRAQA